MKKLTTKYYLGAWSAGPNKDEVFAVFRAQWDGKILMKQEVYPLGAAYGWKPTTTVGRWFFLGDDLVEECSESEALAYLPLESTPVV